jgi:hypothetical protein
MEPRKLFLDTEARNFVGSNTATLAASSPLLFEGDVENIELYFLKPTGNFSAPYTFANYSSGITATLRVGATTAAATVTSWSAISTAVTITASETIAGGSGTSEVQRIQMSPAPATGYYSVQLPTRNVTVSSVSSSIFTAAYHALLDGQSVTLTGFSTPSGFSNGSVYFVRDRSRDAFKIAVTAGGTAITASVASGGGTAVVPTYTTQPLRAMAEPVEVGAALASAAGASSQQISVQGTATDYNLAYGGAYAGAAFPTAAITASTLAGAPGLAGNLNLNVSAITALVAAGTTDVTLEVDVFNGTLRHTYQMPARLGNDL